MFDKSIKLLYFLGGYFVGMATFSYATRLSDLLADDNLLQVCKLGENVLRKLNCDLNELDNRVSRWGIKFYLGQFLCHNDRDFGDCCRIFYLIKTLKSVPLTEEEEVCITRGFIKALQYLYELFCLYKISMPCFGLTEEEYNFLATLDYHELARKIRASGQDSPQQSPESVDAQQSQPTKTSCTFL